MGSIKRLKIMTGGEEIGTTYWEIKDNGEKTCGCCSEASWAHHKQPHHKRKLQKGKRTYRTTQKPFSRFFECNKCHQLTCEHCLESIANEARKKCPNNEWSAFVAGILECSDADKLRLAAELCHCCEHGQLFSTHKQNVGHRKSSDALRRKQTQIKTSKELDGVLYFPLYYLLIYPSFRHPDTLALTKLGKHNKDSPLHGVPNPRSFRPGSSMLGVRPNLCPNFPFIDKRMYLSIHEGAGDNLSVFVRYIFVKRYPDLFEDSWQPGEHLDNPTVTAACSGVLNDSHCASLRRKGVDVVVILGGKLRIMFHFSFVAFVVLC